MTDTTAPNAADRLTAGVDELHVPEPSADAEARLLQVGFILPIIGVVLIVMAWYNASGSKFVSDQIPMLISGGILGLGLAMLGMGLWIRYSLARMMRFWMARLVLEQQAQTDRLIEALGRIETNLEK